jgi:PAS domain S-box-containing protein
MGRVRQATHGLVSRLVLIVAAATVIATFAGWHFTKLDERDHIHRMTRLAASAVAADVEADMNSWLLDQVRLAKLWEFGEPTYTQWTASTGLFLEHHNGCIAIEWLDPAYEERWVSRSPGEQFPLVGGEARERLLKNARDSRQPTLSRLLTSAAARKEWLAVVPIYHRGSFRGFVLGYFDVSRSVDTILTDIKGLNFSVAIQEDGAEAFRLAGSTAENQEQWAQSVDVELPGTTWRVNVWPRPDAMREMHSNLPVAVLIFGFGAGLLLMVIARAAERLKTEVAERKQADELLRASQAQFAGILEISAEAVISTDAKQRITLFNHAAQIIFGYAASEALGQPLDLLIPVRFRAMHNEHIARFAQSGKNNLRMSDRQRVLGLRKDGTEFHMAASVSQLEIAGDKVFTIICNDVTEEVRAQQELRSARDQLEQRVRERTADLETSNRSLQAEIAERKRAEQEIHGLSRRMMRVQEEERRNLARELHDGATPNLVALLLNMSRMRDDGFHGPDTYATLQECMRLAEECTNELRTVSYLLHPPLLEELGLRLTLSGFVQGFSSRSGIAVTLDIRGNLDALGFDVNLAVFRIVQESLSNVHRHSQSRTASISVAREHGVLTLAITDQGRGIPAGTEGSGVGLASMRERVRLLNGRLEIKSGATGTSIMAVLPLAEAMASSSSAGAA